MGSWAGALEEVKLERVLQETRPVLLPPSQHISHGLCGHSPIPRNFVAFFKACQNFTWSSPMARLMTILEGAVHVVVTLMDGSAWALTWPVACLGRVKQPKQTRHVLATWRRCHKCTLASLAPWRSRRWASQRAKLWKVSCTPLSLHECTLTLEPLFAISVLQGWLGGGRCHQGAGTQEETKSTNKAAR